VKLNVRFTHRRGVLYAAITILAATTPSYGLAPRIWMGGSSGYSYETTQVDTPGDDERDEVTPKQLDRYVSVYRAMQKDRSLTVDQAAQNAGFTLTQFRDLEARIERNDALRERARRALRPPKAGETPDDTDGD
jgi:hypothetical protein